MNHPPRQLALLISLIGGGISPYAQARIDEQRVDLAQTLPDIACTELEAVALPACSGTGERDLLWQPQRSALDLSGTAGVLVLYGARGDDWAPGEMPDVSTNPVTWRRIPPTVAGAVETLADATRPPAARKHPAKPRRVRVFAPLARAPLAPLTALAKAEGAVPGRIERSSGKAAAVAAQPSAGSVEVERLLANLAMVLSATPPSSELAEPPVAAAPVAEGERDLRLRAAERAQVERPAITIETQTDKVLRQLGAILSDERDQVGASRRDAMLPTATTQSGKVMAMLGQITSPQSPVTEDGPAKRLRKLAARAAKARAAPAVAHGDVVASGVVDVLLPLVPPALAPLPFEPFASVTRLTLQPAAPAPVAEKARVERAAPFGDRQVAISESSLDRVRGGYAGEGLNISFGIERAVYINGSLVTTTSLNVTDLGQISAGRGAAALDSGTIALIQNGAGNTVAGGSISSSAMGTIVQNTLDGQKIQNVTTINATANSLGLFRTLNLQSSLRGAVIDSLRR